MARMDAHFVFPFSKVIALDCNLLLLLVCSIKLCSPQGKDLCISFAQARKSLNS